MPYTDHFNPRKTPQNQPVPGKKMVQMRSGGYAFEVGDWEQLRRFLILGTIGGTYYASEREMTKECAEVITRCLAEDGQRTVDMIVDVSSRGLALKNDHALFALALASTPMLATEKVRSYALEHLQYVARTATHLFQFVDTIQHYRGWGRSLKNAIADWYTKKEVDDLAYQVVKYRSRFGWTHRDVLRKAHPYPEGERQAALFKWITSGDVLELPQIVTGFLNVQRATTAEQVAQLVRDYNLPREALPTQFLDSSVVWEAMLANRMPMTALVRNLGVMTANGTLKPFSQNTQWVIDQLHREDVIQRSRIHPIQILFAIKTYAQGHGFRGSNRWSPITQIIDALDDAYYLSFDNLEPINKNIVMGVDVSGSMKWQRGDLMTAAEFAAAMAMVQMRQASNHVCKGFDLHLHDMNIRPNMGLDQVMQVVSQTGGGRTAAQLPIQWAANEGIPVDAFIIYSDGESWAGNEHVFQALNRYREVMYRPDTKLVCVNFTATAHSLADSSDPLSLNVVGNSPDIAQAVSAFLEE